MLTRSPVVPLYSKNITVKKKKAKQPAGLFVFFSSSCGSQAANSFSLGVFTCEVKVLAYRGQTGFSQLCHYKLHIYSIPDVNLMVRIVTTDSQVFVHGALEALL